MREKQIEDIRSIWTKRGIMISSLMIGIGDMTGSVEVNTMTKGRGKEDVAMEIHLAVTGLRRKNRCWMIGILV